MKHIKLLAEMAAARQVPEWEHEQTAARPSGNEKPARVAFTMPSRTSWRRKFDTILPPNRKYLRMQRRNFLFVVLATFVALLVLIIGLAVGLKHKHDQDLPLPSNTQSFVGDLTYFQPGLGACGIVSTSSQDIVAVSHILFDAAGSSSSDGGNSNDNPLCNKMLRATRFDEQYGEQRSVDLKVVDRCVGCAVNDLDTSLSAFTQLAPEVDGRVDVTWAWLQPVPTGK